MINKKNITISLSILSLLTMTGCTNSTNVIEKEVNSNIMEENEKKYSKLKIIDRDESNDNINNYGLISNTSKHIKNYELISNTSKHISLINSEEVKSLLGNNIELVKSDESNESSSLYSLKGYESTKDSDEQKSIKLALSEDNANSENTLPYLGIYFTSQSKGLTNSLDSMLSMEDKIDLMLNNLLEKDEAEEVLSLFKEEISRINLEKESAFTKIELPYAPKPYQTYYETGYRVIINTDLYLDFTVTCDENGLYSTSLILNSTSLIRESLS